MEELIQAYKETSFNVFEPKIIIKIGQINEALNQLLISHNCTTWAYITAWNPYSEVVDDLTNAQNNLKLYNDLNCYELFEGEGVGTDVSWKPEKSYLILGITLESAIFMGKKYRQNAIVVGKLDEPAQIVWVR